MKKLFKLFGLLAVTALTVTSCTEEDNVIDQVFDGVSNGAVLRGVVVENELPVGVAGSRFVLDIEEQDNQDGALLESMDVFVSYTDGSEEAGDSTGAAEGEVLLRSVPAADFTAGEFGLPTFQLVITVEEFLAAVGLTDPEAIFGGDTFTTRLVLNLTDGRVFSTDNAGGIITGGFFASPFQYTTPVVCPVEEEFFTGDYNLEQITPTIFGYDTFDPDGGGIIVELFNADQAVDGDGNGILAEPGDAEGMSSTQRAFDADYIAALGFGNTLTYVMDFVCNDVFFPVSQNTGLTCTGGSLTLGPPTVDPAMYNFEDDSTFNFIFVDDEADDCGQGAPNVEVKFTKQ